jgi:YD repeat-containing protein
MDETFVVNFFLTLRVLIVGGILLVIPHITRKGLLFGVYVGEDTVKGRPGRQLLQSWRRSCLLTMLLSLVIGLGISVSGAPVAGNLTGTAVLLLVALVLYLQAHSKARNLVTPTAEGQAEIAVASLEIRSTNEAGFAKLALAICISAGLGTVAYAVVAYFEMPSMVPTMTDSNVMHEKSIITFIITPLFNLVLSPFLALIAVFTAGAKRSMRGGSGGHSKEAQDAFRVASTNLVSAVALLGCAFLTLLSVQIVRIGLSEIDSIGAIVSVGVVAGVFVVASAIGVIWLIKRYGQGGALRETGSVKERLTGSLADNSHWLMGLFYYNADDPSMMIEKRFGVGYSFNYGNRKARLIVLTVLTLLVGLSVLALVGGASASRAVAVEPTELPNTVAGQRAAAYLNAFNTGDTEVMQAFFEEHYSFQYLDSHPLDKRSAYYQQFHDIFGRLTIFRVALSVELQITVLADAAKTDDVLVIRFQLESESPHRLTYVKFSGIDHAKVSDQYVDYVATRAASISSALRASTIQLVAQVFKDQYIYPEIGQKMADTLLQKQAEGRYDDAGRVGMLADMLTEDALAVSNDKHVGVEAQNPTVQESSDPVNLPVEELRQENYHFRKVEVLPDNIGYIRFDMIHDDQEALDITAEALDSLAQCDALIFDIRENMGGEWGTANLILGYLLPGGTVFGYMYDRGGHRVEERAIPDSIPGQPFDTDVPVYVLTSSRTGSAAEGFAYTLKSLDRATIVGEVTLGMAHPSREVVVNDYFRVSVPYLRSENVVTRTSFEGTGVVPTIKVAAARALEAAVEDALRQDAN